MMLHSLQQVKFESVKRYMSPCSILTQLFQIWLMCEVCCVDMSSIQPDFQTLMNICCWLSDLICILNLCSLALMNLDLQVFMYLTYCFLHIILIHLVLILIALWGMHKHHPGINTFNSKNSIHFVVSEVWLSAANLVICSNVTKSFCWWFANTQRYCSILALIGSVCLLVVGDRPLTPFSQSAADYTTVH